MFSTEPSRRKLKVNLGLAITRLKLLEKNKTELALRARPEVADLCRKLKIERARVRVESIIREDYLVEAMELVEMYADILLVRAELLQAGPLHESLKKPVATLIWAAPRLSHYCEEMQVIRKKLKKLFVNMSVKVPKGEKLVSKKFVKVCKTNENNLVCERVIAALDPRPPQASLIERYLIEICRNAGVPFTPDDEVLVEERFRNGQESKGKRQNSDLPELTNTNFCRPLALGGFGGVSNGFGGGAGIPGACPGGYDIGPTGYGSGNGNQGQFSPHLPDYQSHSSYPTFQQNINNQTQFINTNLQNKNNSNNNCFDSNSSNSNNTYIKNKNCGVPSGSGSTTSAKCPTGGDDNQGSLSLSVQTRKTTNNQRQSYTKTENQTKDEISNGGKDPTLSIQKVENKNRLINLIAVAPPSHSITHSFGLPPVPYTRSTLQSSTRRGDYDNNSTSGVDEIDFDDFDRRFQSLHDKW